jgi:hypothetical protein
VTEKKRKWADVAWSDIKKQLQSKDVCCLPESLPKPLRDLIFSCCNPEEALRPTFFSILADTQWNDIIMDALNKGQEAASDIWARAKNEKGQVEFENLVDAYLRKFIPEVQVSLEE